MRTVLITGVSSDIGLATARHYLAAGWRVIGHYRTPRPEVLALAQEAGARLTPWRCDFADPAALEAALAAAPVFDPASSRSPSLSPSPSPSAAAVPVPAWGAVDALITLAAELRPQRFDDLTADDLLRSFTVNLLPGLLLTRALAPGMVARGWGRIVHGSSIGVKFGGGADSFAYSLAKHALEFMPSAHKVWARSGVLVNALRIGVADTRFHARDPGKDMAARVAMIPAGRMAAAHEIAATLFWLGSEHNSYTTGQVIACAGGE